MTQTSMARGYGDLGFQLREFAEHLDKENFLALSPGIGIGGIRMSETEPGRKPLRVESQPPTEPAWLPPTVSKPMESGAGSPYISKASEGSMRSSGKNEPALDRRRQWFSKRQKKMNRNLASPVKAPVVAKNRGAPAKGTAAAGFSHVRTVVRWFRRFLALGIDLAIVVFCLATAMAAVTAALTFDQGREDFWMQGGPINWLNRFEYWELATVMGGVFLIYFGLFKLVAGRTFGTMLSEVGQTLPNK